MTDFLYDVPLTIIGLVIIGLLYLFVLVGLAVVRRRILPRLQVQGEDSHFTGTMVHSVMVFYGLAVALMAVNVSERYANVSEIVSGEATAIAVLYRDISSYPEPIRKELQEESREYVLYVIREAWPLQRSGKIPEGGVDLMNRFQATLVAFEPVTEGQKLMHGETLHAYNQLIETRRQRLDALSSSLPGVMWVVIICGALIGLTASFFFKVADARLHRIQVMLLATFIGLIIFMIFAQDHPFRGDLALTAEPYQLIYDHLMK